MKSKLNITNKIDNNKIVSNFYNENQYKNGVYGKKIDDFTILQSINDKLSIIIPKGKYKDNNLNIESFFIVNKKGKILNDFENRHKIYNPKIVEKNIENNIFYTLEGNINTKDKDNHIFALFKKEGDEIKTLINGNYGYGDRNSDGPIFDNFIFDGENIILSESKSKYYKTLSGIGKQLFVYDKKGIELFNSEYNAEDIGGKNLYGILDYQKTDFGYMIGTNKIIKNETHHTNYFHYELLDKNGNDLIKNKKLKSLINWSGGIKEVEKINDNLYSLNVSTNSNCAFSNIYMGQILVDNNFEPILKKIDNNNIFSDIEKTKDGWKCRKINKVGLEEVRPYETIYVMLYQDNYYDNDFNLINTSKEEKGESDKCTNSYLKLSENQRKYFANCYYNEEEIFNIKNEINEGKINEYILKEIENSPYKSKEEIFENKYKDFGKYTLSLFKEYKKKLTLKEMLALKYLLDNNMNNFYNPFYNFEKVVDSYIINKNFELAEVKSHIENDKCYIDYDNLLNIGICPKNISKILNEYRKFDISSNDLNMLYINGGFKEDELVEILQNSSEYKIKYYIPLAIKEGNEKDGKKLNYEDFKKYMKYNGEMFKEIIVALKEGATDEVIEKGLKFKDPESFSSMEWMNRAEKYKEFAEELNKYYGYFNLYNSSLLKAFTRNIFDNKMTLNMVKIFIENETDSDTIYDIIEKIDDKKLKEKDILKYLGK